MQNIRRMAKDRPLEARQALHELVEKFVPVSRPGPTEKGIYEAEVTFENDPAAISGDQGEDIKGCGAGFEPASIGL